MSTKPATQEPAVITSWQDHVAYTNRFLADALLYPNIAQDDLEKAQWHLGKAIEGWHAAQTKVAG